MGLTSLLYKKNVVFSERDEMLEKQLSGSFSIDPVMARVMINRGIKTISESKNYLYPELKNLSSPYLLKGMDATVSRVCRAVENKESILIYGDYDVDGITSIALLKRALGDLTKVGYYIPDRIKEGYGLNKAAVDKIHSEGYDLIITVDCGITSLEEISHAKTLGMDVIILDHHHPVGFLPDTEYIIDPKQDGCPGDMKELAGVGVVYMLIFALKDRLRLDERIFLEFVALGTIADMAPLVGENRILVKNGLEQINTTVNPGLRSLINQSGLANNKIDVGHVSFMLAPRINASGRISRADTSVELLLTSEQSAADSLAYKLCRMNEERQSIESDILKETINMIENDINLREDTIIVLDSKKWHPGVIGIVASKIVDRFSKPAILIAHDQNSLNGKGSARSRNGLNIFKAISECKDILLSYGGHEMASGLLIETRNIEKFKKRINEAARNIMVSDTLLQKWTVDSVVDFSDLNLRFIELLEGLAPFGFGNSKPVFMSENVSLIDYPRIVGNNHVKLKVKKGSVQRDVIGFNMGDRYEDILNINGPVDIIFNLSKNMWQSKASIQLELKDIVAS